MEFAHKVAMALDRHTSTQWAIGAGHSRSSTPDKPHMAVKVACQPNSERTGFKRIHIKEVVYASAAALTFTDFVTAVQDEYRVSNVAMQIKDVGYWAILQAKGISPQLALYLDRTGVELIFPKAYTPDEARACTSLAFAAASIALLQADGGVSFL